MERFPSEHTRWVKLESFHIDSLDLGRCVGGMYFVHSTDKHSELNFSVVIPLEQLLDVRSKIDTAIDQLLTKMASQEDPRARVGKIHDPAWRLVEQEPEVQDDEEEPKVQDDEEEPKVQDD